jgi:CubicO group peptidase (beta-lactamase class C family)
MKKIFLLIISAVLVTSCLKEKPLKQSFSGYEPAVLQDGWTVSTPENEQVDPAILGDAYSLIYADDRFAMANSLLVFRNGKLIAEAYPKTPDDRDRLNNLQSITKSFTSLLTGIALQDGLIGSIDDPVYNYYPEAFDDVVQKRDITIRNCLTMRAGLDFDNSEQTEQLYHCTGSSVQFVISLPMIYDTGEMFQYNDGLPHLVGAIVAKKSGMSLSSYAEMKLFRPVGISKYKWENAADGLNFGAFALYLTPRDLGRIGKLLAQQGNWEGTQVVDSAWIRQATSVQSGTSSPYGFYFWPYPALKGYMMEGHGGQILYICPEKNLVVVYTAYPYTNSILWDEVTTLAELIFRAAK